VRKRHVAAGSLQAIFFPLSVAVVGASATEGKLGHTILSNMLGRGFTGPLYPVNPKEREILGLTAYATLADIPGPVDLVIIAVPGRYVPELIEQAAGSGVRGAIVISAGFSETETSEGIGAEEHIRQITQEAGMAIIGPNCQGVLSARGNVSAWFGPLPERPGRGLFISQSGGLAGTLIDWTNRRDVTLFDSVVSLGNKCSVDEADLLEAFVDDPAVRFAMCYTEGFKPGRGRAFMESAKAFAQHKPVVVLKGGRSSAGGRATSSHTGSLAGSDRLFTGAMAQAGVYLTNSVREFINAARLAATQLALRGTKILILTNLGGPGVIAADLCERYGLEVAPTPNAMRESLHQRIPSYCAVANPIDLAGDPDPERYGAILDVVYREEGFNDVLIVAAPLTGSAQIAADIVRAYKRHPKPTAVCWMSEDSQGVVRPIFEAGGLPVFAMPEDAVRALATLAPRRPSVEPPNRGARN